VRLLAVVSVALNLSLLAVLALSGRPQAGAVIPPASASEGAVAPRAAPAALSPAPVRAAAPVLPVAQDCLRVLGRVSDALNGLDNDSYGIPRPDRMFREAPPGSSTVSAARVEELNKVVLRATGLTALGGDQLSCRGNVCRVALPDGPTNKLAAYNDEWLDANMRSIAVSNDGVYLDLGDKPAEHLAAREIERLLAGFQAAALVSRCLEGPAKDSDRFLVHVQVGYPEPDRPAFTIRPSPNQALDARGECLLALLQQYAGDNAPPAEVTEGGRGYIDLLHP
jgi:hypothetical protein